MALSKFEKISLLLLAISISTAIFLSAISSFTSGLQNSGIIDDVMNKYAKSKLLDSLSEKDVIINGDCEFIGDFSMQNTSKASRNTSLQLTKVNCSFGSQNIHVLTLLDRLQSDLFSEFGIYLG